MSNMLRAVIALFVDDELLAAGIVIVVALTALTAFVIDDRSLAGGLLVLGIIAVLVVGVMRTARRK
jgi:hypothetical protein